MRESNTPERASGTSHAGSETMRQSALDRLIPAPRLLEVDRLDLRAPRQRVWEHIRHGNLGSSPFVRALFAVRTLPDRVRGERPEAGVRLDALVSSSEKPGFQILVEDPPNEVAIGAIGKVWQMSIPFVHLPGAAEFLAFADPDYVKVAWAIRLFDRSDGGTHLELEVRVDATDAAAWDKFRRYFALVGIGSHFIRRTLCAQLERELGSVGLDLERRSLPGDELLPDGEAAITHSVDIQASPSAIWPWLVQMGSLRAGFYSFDLLDNQGLRSAREVHPELQKLAVGDVIPATPGEDGGFEVLRLEAPTVLVLGGLYDPDAKRQLAFASPRPEHYWQVTWSFTLEPLDERTTRLWVRVRAAFSTSGRLHATWIRPVHQLMQSAELRGLKARVEGSYPRDDWHDVLEGLDGAGRMLVALVTPFLRQRRSHWGLDAKTAARSYPGDDLVPEPLWSWTHAVEIDAAAEEVWPFVAQIGADRAGFYSYQLLENLAGCDLSNAETVHPEWEVKEGQELALHPDIASLRVVAVERGRHFVAHAPKDPANGKWVTASWLFQVEPITPERCRFISRYRVSCSTDLATRLGVGPTLLEPIGFAMDRRMLLGVKQRAEARHIGANALQRLTNGG